MGLSTTHILMVIMVALLLFGRGKISELMDDVAKGIKCFKKGLSEEDEPTKLASRILESEVAGTDRTKVM